MRVKIEIAFLHKPKPDTLLHKAIRWWTKSKYSHVELGIDGYWVSAENYGIITFNTRPSIEQYTILRYDLDVSMDDYDRVIAFIDKVRGSKYDYLGIFLAQIIPLHVQDPKRWFCSELTTRLLKMLGEPKVKDIVKPSSMSPGDLAVLYDID